jgi:soluble lytic murein transglycosylase-like protein
MFSISSVDKLPIPRRFSIKSLSSVLEQRRRCAFLLLAACLLLMPGALHAEYVVFKNGSQLQISFHLLEADNKVKLILKSEGFAVVDASSIEKFEQEDYIPPEPGLKALQLPPLPLPSYAAPYHKLIVEASKRTGLHEMLIATVIEAESNFDRYAVSRKGARGLMQLTPQTASDLGVHSIYDPKENILAGARYLRDLLAQFKNDLSLALAAYNAGPDKVLSYRGIPPFRETQDYVRKVVSRFARRRETVTGP